MTVRRSLVGGLAAGAFGAALGGALAALQGVDDTLWIYTALGAAMASLVGWTRARRRFN